MLNIKDFEGLPSWPRLEQLSKSVALREVGFALEFGVFNGNSLNHLATLVKEQNFYGFDSFEGLPEDWMLTDTHKNPKGLFKTVVPEVCDNVQLVIGWFSDTLPGWLEKHQGNVGFLHMDADLYSSTKYVLETLNNRIVKGTVIVFDELCEWRDTSALKVSYKNWRDGEWKALQEWLDGYGREVKALSKGQYLEAAFVVTK